MPLLNKFIAIIGLIFSVFTYGFFQGKRNQKRKEDLQLLENISTSQTIDFNIDILSDSQVDDELRAFKRRIGKK